jgi:hypothetical protein
MRRSLFGWTGERARGVGALDRLPPGSRGAVRAVLNDDPKFADFHVIRSPRVWDEGLFMVHPDTVFHFRLRVDEPGTVFVNFNTRFADPTVRSGWVRHSTQILAAELTPGEWQTFHLPCSGFRENVNGPAPDGTPRVAVIVYFGSGRFDRGLTVDEFWVTRGPD